ncbi:uncharacterized protein BJX67DRAFT_99473 [Aspergillus lucknowensis]|uniref:Uncharacterized protein n=1 Tax=Aspergillus lucknowensis TaxID=176173 RepID=A0ABR4M697_9EURO
MSFTSFSTSILYGRERISSVMQNATQTTGTARENHSEIPCHADIPDCTQLQHYLHELTSRDVRPKNKTSVPGRPSNGSNPGNLTLNKAKGRPSHWSMDKASIAASTIFGAISSAALLFIVWLCVKKLRRRRRRRRRGDVDSLAAEMKKRRREGMMFWKNSPCTYLVEQNNGAVTRVLCTRNKGGASVPSTPPNTLNNPLEPVSSIQQDVRIDTVRYLDELNKSCRGRSGSIPKSIVIVSPPLQPVVSRIAVPDSQPTGPTELPESMESTETTEPIEPGKQVEPLAPLEPSKAIELCASTEQSKVVEAAKSTEPTESIWSTVSTEPTGSTGSTEPTESTESSELAELTTSPTLQVLEMDQISEPEAALSKSHSGPLFRLPSIRQTLSPLFNF